VATADSTIRRVRNGMPQLKLGHSQSSSGRTNQIRQGPWLASFADGRVLAGATRSRDLPS